MVVLSSWLLWRSRGEEDDKVRSIEQGPCVLSRREGERGINGEKLLVHGLGPKGFSLVFFLDGTLVLHGRSCFLARPVQYFFILI